MLSTRSCTWLGGKTGNNDAVNQLQTNSPGPNPMLAHGNLHQVTPEGFQKLWLGWTRAPLALRCDMSGSHMSDHFACLCDQHGIKPDLRLQTHHKREIQERNHAVRRRHLLIYENMYPQGSTKQAIQCTLAARLRVRNVKRDSPVQRVLRFQPHMLVGEFRSSSQRTSRRQ